MTKAAARRPVWLAAALAPLLTGIALAAPSATTASTEVRYAAVPGQVMQAAWFEGDADSQHDSNNRFETLLSPDNVRSLHASLTVLATGRSRLTMPTVDGANRLYFGRQTPGQESTTVEAHDATTGRLLWRRTRAEPFEPFARQPKYLNGRVYFTSSGGVTPSSVYDDTAALDAATGNQVWKVDGVADVAGNNQVFVRNFACDSGGCWEFNLTAYDAATGAVTWRRTVTVDYTYAGGFSGAVLNAGTLYFGEDDAQGHYWLRAVDAGTGAERWSTPAPSSAPRPAAVDAATGIVLVAEGDTVRAVDGAAGAVLWSRTGLRIINGSEEWLPGGAAGGAVAVGQGEVFALCGASPGSQLCTTRLSDGAALTSYRPPSCSTAANGWTALALANGVLYGTTSRCGVVAIDTAAKQVIGTVVAGSKVLRPEVVDGRVYAGTTRGVTAWQPYPALRPAPPDSHLPPLRALAR